MSQRISFRSLYKLFIWRPHSTAEKQVKGAWFLRFQHAWENIIVAEMLLGSCSSWRCTCCLEVPVVPNLHSATGLTVYQGNTKAMTIYQGNTPKIQWVAWSCLHVGVRWMGYAPSVLDFPHALAKPFDMPRTSKQKWSHAMSFPHAALLRKKLQSCNWTHPAWE